MASKQPTKIGEIIRERLETVDESNTAQQAAKKLRTSDLSSLLVIDSRGKPIGIITERDLVRKVCATDERSSKVYIQNIMSTPVITVDSSSPLRQAANIMIQNKVRHLLVVGDNGPDGIVSTSDFAKFLKQNVDMDEVNATIIKSLLEEKEDGLEDGMNHN
jgi:signal-transduction protein with cAMP-binding, CBS, and nucleotidyltransferase domain